ncbi:CHAT domain-containing protein [Spirulina major]|uniref:CHAT domain-containing protein n=1 Tax=Spirulina major TaxID=270636 RepID=UPI0009FFB97C|nr:CHAT domain-containing protein [Spirulina major]
MSKPLALPLFLTVGSLFGAMPAVAQSIIPAADGTGTVIDYNGITYTIEGGTQAGANLFHSFAKLGLNSGEIASFLSNSTVTNILGRVTGGDPSVIHGLLQVSGADSNLYLINPAGIVFGTGARLDVGGDFWATTADRIGFEGGWWDASGANDYATLVGEPHQFAFLSETPGAIINAGTLTAGRGVHLLGGTIINTGTIQGDGVTLAAVPGERWVKVTPKGSLLSVEVPLEAIAAGIAPTDLPALLTGGAVTTEAAVVTGSVHLEGEVTGDRVDLWAADRVTVTTPAMVGGDVRVARFSEGGLNPNQAVFIDQRADQAEALLFGGAAGTVTQMVKRDKDGLAIATTQLAELSDAVGPLASVAIVAEGNAGNFWFGNQWITSETVQDYQTQLQTWSDSLTAGADLLLYSCFTALGATGDALMTSLADFTGADVAASLNATGSANYGADWGLERSTGAIEAHNPFPVTTLEQWSGKLATLTVTNYDDAGVGTLRSQIAAAAAGDTVTFADASRSVQLNSEIAWATDNLTIDGNGATVSGQNRTRVFNIAADTATLQNIRIQNGRVAGNGAGINHTGTGALTLDQVRLRNNQATGSGGGIYSDSGTVTIANHDGNLDLDLYGRNRVSLGGTGRILLTGDVQTNEALTLTAATTIDITGLTLTAGNVTLTAGDQIRTGDLKTVATPDGAMGAIALTAANRITTGSLDTSSATGGGAITLTAGRRIATGAIATTATTSGNAGAVSLRAAQTIQTGAINTEARVGRGGDVTLNTLGFMQIDGAIARSLFSEINDFPVEVSISTAGRTAAGAWNSGQVNILHGGLNPFRVGEAVRSNRSGTSGWITTGLTTLETGIYEQNLDFGDLRIRRQCPVICDNDEDFVGGMDDLNPSDRYVEQPRAHSPAIQIRTNTVNSLGDPKIIATLSQIDRLMSQDYTAAFQQLAGAQTPQTSSSDAEEGDRTDVFAQLLNNQGTPNQTNTPDLAELFTYIREQTGTSYGFIYALSLPDAIELILITPDSKVIRQIIPEADRATLNRTVTTFRRRIQGLGNGYQTSASQLYDWLIRPLEPYLADLDVDTLVFSMSEALRTIPLAALYDGERFLVEKYSLGQVPSLSLTDRTYRSVQNPTVLAMGASEFDRLQDLPSVPLELQSITQNPTSRAFLNQDFTLENLRTYSRDRTFNVIHLATHAAFQPDQLDQAYIQLWDERLLISDLRTLGWNNAPPVELLVLSACDTAFDDPTVELGFAGLAVQAGVKSALASLWQVSDLGTLGLMDQFYAQLNAPTPLIKAEALRQAQLNLLRGQTTIRDGAIANLDLPPGLAQYDLDLTHPFYWSGFTLVGSPW